MAFESAYGSSLETTNSVRELETGGQSCADSSMYYTTMRGMGVVFEYYLAAKTNYSIRVNITVAPLRKKSLIECKISSLTVAFPMASMKEGQVSKVHDKEEERE